MIKKISTIQLVPGMTVAEDVFTYDRQLILSKGTILNDRLIMKLDLYGILTIFIEGSVSASSSEVSPQEQTYLQRIKEDPVFPVFKREYEISVNFLQENIKRVIKGSLKLDINELLKGVLRVLGVDRGRIGILDLLQNMRAFDSSTFSHSINVALICNLLAGWLKWDTKRVELATACGLFHDIGKIQVPHAIITKPGRLSAKELAVIQQHPALGCQLLISQNADEHICNAALMHHERCDGSGYPTGLKGDQIDPYAKLVAIVDVYDAMTAPRVYRGPLCPFRVIELFEAEGFQKYEVAYLLAFMENVVNSYIQSPCLLSDGRKGTIIYINKSHLSRPIVQCGTEYVNLLEHPDLSIVSLL